MAGANELTIIVDADIDGLRQQLENARRETQSFSDRIGSLGAEIAKLGTAMTVGLTVPIVALGKASIEAYAKLQALELGVEAVAGSATFAGKQLGNLREIAKLPGLGLQEAVKGSINLQAIGYSAGNAEKILKEFGNAVASVGKGRVEFDRAIYGVQQLANTEFPLGEDLNIIADALPQVRTLLKEAFGTSRTEELQKLGIKSKQVMDVILTGLEKLPRVNGGIKNAFENLGDSIQQNLARIGKVIDDRFNISGIIDKLTNALDKLISGFEELSPAMQTTVLVLTGLAAATGPVLVGLGGIMLAAPLVVNGFTAIKTAVEGLTAAMLRNPYTAVAVALAAIGAAVYVYYSSLETAKDRQERFNDALTKATLQAKNEVSELKKLYATSQDQNKSLDERNKAVDQLQKQYPAYFQNLSNEAILAGKASQAYKNLTVDIVKASRARAATAELDKRNADRLERELELNKKLKDALAVYYSDNPDAVIKFNQENPFDGIDARSGIKAGAKKYIKEVLSQLSVEYKSALREDKDLKKIIEDGINPIAKLDTVGADNFLPGLDKVKKESQKQLAEIYPIGSIAELRQRAELLVKAIETSNNDIIKIRGLDKFGNDKTKDGLPIYTGEILRREEAVERLAKINELIGEELKPVKIQSAGFMDSLGNEFKTFNDLFQSESTRTYNILNTQLPGMFASGFAKIQEVFKQAKLKEAVEELNKDLSNVLNQDVTQGITDAFSAIGSAFTTGGNLFKSLGTSLLNSSGKILSDLGKQMIQYGVSLLALKIAMKSLNPYIAIAAGAALVAIGAGVSAFAQKQNESIGSGGGTTSTASSVPNYTSSSFTGGGSGGGNEVIFRLSGPDLIGAFNRNVSAEDRVSAG